MSDEIDDDVIESFSSLDELFGVEFEKEQSIKDIDDELSTFKSNVNDPVLKKDANTLMKDIKTEIAEIDTKKEELQTNLVGARIKDSEFLELEIKSLILSSKRVLQTLEKDIKVGAQPRMYEVYATLLGAITSQYKELRNLNESIARFVLENKKQNFEEVKEEHKMIMSSSDLLSMYQNAKDNSQMDALETTFDIVDTNEVR